MPSFNRIDIAQIIRKSAVELNVPIIAIFREADVNHTNMNKWEKPRGKKASPNRRTENKILDAIERIAKRNNKHIASHTGIHRSVNH